jgi:hypothetical protein
MMRFILNTALFASLLVSCHCATSACNQDLYSKAVAGANDTLVVTGAPKDYNGVSIRSKSIFFLDFANPPNR